MASDTVAVIATISAAVAAIAATLATIVALYQARLAQRATNLVALLPFYDKYHSDRFRAIRRKLYGGGYDMNDLVLDEEEDVRELLNTLEFLGALVANRVVEFRTASAVFYHSPVDAWPWLRPFIERVRSQSPNPVPNYARNYERLVGRYRR